MANLVRRDPFRDMYSMSKAFDRMLEKTFGEFGEEWDADLQASLPLDVIEKGNEFIVKANVAGFDPDKIDVTYTDNALTIKGEMKEEKESKEEGKYHLHERRVGSFFRSITLPGSIDSGKIEAEIENGILTLHLPKKEESQPKRIEIKPKNVKVIEANTK